VGVWGDGVGRERSKAGNWIYRHGISQGQLSKWSGLGRNTLSRICSDPDYKPTNLTQRRMIDGLIKNGYNVGEYDLW
jgi:hypothetical protein